MLESVLKAAIGTCLCLSSAVPCPLYLIALVLRAREHIWSRSAGASAVNLGFTPDCLF